MLDIHGRVGHHEHPGLPPELDLFIDRRACVGESGHSVVNLDRDEAVDQSLLGGAGQATGAG